MNVSELSTNLYRQAGVDAAALRRINVTRRSDRPAELGADHSDGPKFSEVLAELATKHAPAAISGSTESEESPALSTTQMRSILKKALSADNISSDIVNALTDSSGEVSDALLDMIFSADEDDEEESLSDLLAGDNTSAALNDILTNARTAQEYLSSTSGRSLIVAMADRSLSSLIS